MNSAIRRQTLFLTLALALASLISSCTRLAKVFARVGSDRTSAISPASTTPLSYVRVKRFVEKGLEGSHYTCFHWRVSVAARFHWPGRGGVTLHAFSFADNLSVRFHFPARGGVALHAFLLADNLSIRLHLPARRGVYFPRVLLIVLGVFIDGDLHFFFLNPPAGW